MIASFKKLESYGSQIEGRKVFILFIWALETNISLSLELWIGEV